MQDLFCEFTKACTHIYPFCIERVQIKVQLKTNIVIAINAKIVQCLVTKTNTDSNPLLMDYCKPIPGPLLQHLFNKCV